MAASAKKLEGFRRYHIGAGVAFLFAALSVYLAFYHRDDKLFGQITVGLWTIIPPIVFWVDGAWWLRRVKKDDRDIAIHLHDLGRNIWLALIAILAALFKFTWPT